MVPLPKPSYGAVSRIVPMIVENRPVSLTVTTLPLGAQSKVCDGPIPTATRLAGFAGVTKKQIVKTEHAVLGDLDWNLQSVTVYHYVHLLMPYLEDPTEKLKMYSEHVAVAQALSYQFLHYEPSTLAVATICVAAELVVSSIPLCLRQHALLRMACSDTRGALRGCSTSRAADMRRF